tara:strand:+ start:158 stop:373 length:216 start_codon:yes stop_codon:yes gene_type:complete
MSLQQSAHPSLPSGDARVPLLGCRLGCPLQAPATLNLKDVGIDRAQNWEIAADLGGIGQAIGVPTTLPTSA